MPDESVFDREEAQGLLEVVKNYLLHLTGDLPAGERRGIGRLLSEVCYSLDAHPVPARGEPYPVEAHRQVLSLYRRNRPPGMDN
jgi:hypothetical protein